MLQKARLLLSPDNRLMDFLFFHIKRQISALSLEPVACGRTQSGMRSCVILSCDSSRVRVPLWGGQNTYTTMQVSAVWHYANNYTWQEEMSGWLRHYGPAKSRGVYGWLIEIWVSVSTDWKQYTLGVTYQLSAWVELTQVLPVLCFFCAIKWLLCMNIQTKRSTWVTRKDTTGFKFWRMGKILILKGKAGETE